MDLLALKSRAGDPTIEALGVTWFRRGSQSSAGHTEVQSPRKSAGNAIVANDDRYALAA